MRDLFTSRTSLGTFFRQTLSRLSLRTLVATSEAPMRETRCALPTWPRMFSTCRLTSKEEVWVPRCSQRTSCLAPPKISWAWKPTTWIEPMSSQCMWCPTNNTLWITSPLRIRKSNLKTLYQTTLSSSSSVPKSRPKKIQAWFRKFQCTHLENRTSTSQPLTKKKRIQDLSQTSLKAELTRTARPWPRLRAQQWARSPLWNHTRGISPSWTIWPLCQPWEIKKSPISNLRKPIRMPNPDFKIHYWHQLHLWAKINKWRLTIILTQMLKKYSCQVPDPKS